MSSFEMPEFESNGQQSSALIAVLGRQKGKTANLKVLYRPKKKPKGFYTPFQFELQKFNFMLSSNITQIVASTSHNKLHLAFNQGNDTVSFYDYTNVCVAKHERPERSLYFPQTIEYHKEGKEKTIAILELPGESIQVLKETDPGVWLLYLRLSQSHVLYNLCTNGLIHCNLEGLPSPKSLVKLHPDFYMGSNEMGLYKAEYNVIRSTELRCQI